MSTILEELKNNKIKNVINGYNKTIQTLSINYNNEIKRVTRIFMSIKQKQLLITNINKTYEQFKTSYKNNLDNQIKTIESAYLLQISSLTNVNNGNVNNGNVNNGTKKALIIGINYRGTSSELNGCINDAKSIEAFLKQKNFNDIKMLTDETLIKPTKINILNEIKSLLQNSNKNDTLFIYYSGHGSYTLDRNGDELDGRDELLVPLDFNYIKDDELKQIIDSYGKPDTNLIALFDCCNSGTALDLRYQILEKLNYDDITENKKNTETPCNTIFISGCRDEQLSIETIINDKVQGLMTWAFLETIKKNNITWRELIKKMRETLKQNSYQIPQLSSGKVFNPDTTVVI